MHAFVAIKRRAVNRMGGGGASFAYLPNTDITLPAGWEWAMIDGKIDTMDVTAIAQGMSLEDTCRMMSAPVGVRF